MVSVIISRVVSMLCGTLYPAYRSYKAVKAKDVKEYVKWMMYWIVFALFCCAETLADIFVAFWMPFYYELKIIFLLWLLSPYTKGASYLYRKLIHPTLSRHETEIDAYLDQLQRNSYQAMMRLGNQGWSYARETVTNVALRSQLSLVQQLKKSASLNDIQTDEIIDAGDYPQRPIRRAVGDGGPRRPGQMGVTGRRRIREIPRGTGGGPAIEEVDEEYYRDNDGVDFVDGGGGDAGYYDDDEEMDEIYDGEVGDYGDENGTGVVPGPGIRDYVPMAGYVAPSPSSTSSRPGRSREGMSQSMTTSATGGMIDDQFGFLDDSGQQDNLGQEMDYDQDGGELGPNGNNNHQAKPPVGDGRSRMGTGGPGRPGKSGGAARQEMLYGTYPRRSARKTVKQAE